MQIVDCCLTFNESMEKTFHETRYEMSEMWSPHKDNKWQ